MSKSLFFLKIQHKLVSLTDFLDFVRFSDQKLGTRKNTFRLSFFRDFFEKDKGGGVVGVWGSVTKKDKRKMCRKKRTRVWVCGGVS